MMVAHWSVFTAFVTMCASIRLHHARLFHVLRLHVFMFYDSAPKRGLRIRWCDLQHMEFAFMRLILCSNAAVRIILDYHGGCV